MTDEEALCSRVSPQPPELGQHLINVPFDPPPPAPLFVPSLVQRRGRLGDPLRVGDWGISGLGGSSLRAEEVSFHDNPGNLLEWFPVLLIARARFTAVGQVDGAGGVRVRVFYLISIGVANTIGRGRDCSKYRIVGPGAIKKH